MLILVRETSEETDPAEREGKVRLSVVSGDHQLHKHHATAITGCKFRVKKILPRLVSRSGNALCGALDAAVAIKKNTAVLSNGGASYLDVRPISGRDSVDRHA
jgi:hypothetical protein